MLQHTGNGNRCHDWWFIRSMCTAWETTTLWLRKEDVIRCLSRRKYWINSRKMATILHRLPVISISIVKTYNGGLCKRILSSKPANKMVIVLFTLSSINICLYPLGNFCCTCASDFIDLKFKVGQFQIELGQKGTKIFQSKL